MPSLTDTPLSSDPDDEFYARQQANEERAEERAHQREINNYEPRQEH